MWEDLLELNQELLRRMQKTPDRAAGRQLLADSFGEFKPIPVFQDKPWQGWQVVGIDGSQQTIGANYPYQLALLQALALASQGGEQLKQRVITPLLAEGEEEVRQLVREKGLSQELAFSRLRDRHLAQLELETLLELIFRQKPQAIMLDGGFLRLEQAWAEGWQQLYSFCLEENILLIGVIEEVGTNAIAQELGEKAPPLWQRAYDREILYDLLQEGELLLPYRPLAVKDRYYTVFLRPGTYPQAIALDLLAEQKNKAQLAAALVISLCPAGGRGIPWLLDLIDQKVKLTRQQTDALLDYVLDLQVREKFLRSMRERR
ncbi:MULTISPECIES: DNA double-strand break repair nuclease NurA [unclassified Carboxydocella]|uniref:DNA double-strand break repair nuclease NurA n=1 Tax=unclassified Carboxydocella TaxID=2685367 RepID=UPI0009AEAD23|nr:MULTISPECIES: DNA double-strand break repair nuclease NurA [unclassified Carboxydocella]GAW27695.1 hypothetical protein ULO1_02650 [Carboxydocella sp. ULO1]GAW31891.1 hypothetical protein JDF658_16560 [Carboxydocella sp. JDF658]